MLHLEVSVGGVAYAQITVQPRRGLSSCMVGEWVHIAPLPGGTRFESDWLTARYEAHVSLCCLRKP